MVMPLISFSSLRLWMLFLLLLVSYPLAAFGLVNVTVERGDPQIAYGPKFDAEWKEAWPGVTKSSDPNAVATFTFTGTALFYEGWLWSGPTMFQAQIDDQTPITIDLTDNSYSGNTSTAVPTSSKTILLWPLLPDAILTQLANETGEVSHTIVFSRKSEQREIIIGRLIYSTDNPPPNLTTTPAAFAPNATASSSQPSSTAQSSASKNLRIIIPSVLGGVIAIGLIIGLIVCCIRRRRQPPRVRFNLPVVTKTTTVTQDQMKNNRSSISLKRATRGLVDHVWDPRVIHVKQVDKAAHPNWRIE